MLRILSTLLLTLSLALGPAAGITLACDCASGNAGASACGCCCEPDPGAIGGECCCCVDQRPAGPTLPDRSPPPPSGAAMDGWIAADVIGTAVVLPRGTGIRLVAATATAGADVNHPALARLCIWRT